MSATIEKLKANKSSVENDFDALPEIQLQRKQHRKILRRRQLIGFLLLILVLSAVGYGVYRFKLRGLVAREIVDHLPLPPDRPPTEITGFPIRYAGEDLTPRSLAFFSGTLYVSFIEQPIVQLYNSDLALIANWRLQRPDTLVPAQIAVTDSFFVAADQTNELIGIYDHEGYYVASVAWYPGRSARVTPSHISVTPEAITVVDEVTNYIVSVSLLNDAPYHKFLELLKVTPSPFKPDSARTTCAFVAPDSSLWLGATAGKAVKLEGNQIIELEKPTHTKLRHPVQFLAVDHAIKSEQYPDPEPVMRIHLLDQVSGKVFVYDLAGRLKLVYPQDRSLEQPLAIAVDQEARHIYIAESARSEITVFGF